jgi:hypothetical protein
MKVTFNSKALFKSVNDNVDKTVKATSVKLLNKVRQLSPVRSGLFKSSWRMSGNKKKYNISNSQPYGHALEHGRSKKAPSGVVGPSIKTTIK